MRTSLSERRSQFQRLVNFGYGMPIEALATEFEVLSKRPDRYNRVKRAAYLRLIVCNDKSVSGLPYPEQKTATRFDLGIPNPRWVTADGYTKDLLDGAVLMATFGGKGSRYAKYDMTICEYADGRIIPVHGMTKMDPVSSIVEAKKALMDYWQALPDKSKLTYRH